MRRLSLLSTMNQNTNATNMKLNASVITKCKYQKQRFARDFVNSYIKSNLRIIASNCAK